MKKFYLFTAILITFGLGLNSCGGRLPSQAKTAKMSQKYFKKYGKKYKAPDFYQKEVQSVEVQDIRELQRDMAMGLVVLKMNDGAEIPIVITTLKKVPMGWRIIGWEKMQDSAPEPEVSFQQ